MGAANSMKTKTEKTLICPNCFGTSHRQVLATATSRNITDDDSVPTESAAGGLSGRQKGDVVRLFCNDCGHELTRSGGRG